MNSLSRNRTDFELAYVSTDESNNLYEKLFGISMFFKEIFEDFKFIFFYFQERSCVVETITNKDAIGDPDAKLRTVLNLFKQDTTEQSDEKRKTTEIFESGQGSCYWLK